MEDSELEQLLRDQQYPFVLEFKKRPQASESRSLVSAVRNRNAEF